MNLYATIDEVKRNLGLSGNDSDAVLLDLIEEASREIDDYCSRHFYAETGMRYFPSRARCVVVDDLLSVTTLEVDRYAEDDWDEETWTQGTHFRLKPYNRWPKTLVELDTDYDEPFPVGSRRVRITGEWGYGDGQSSSPWEATDVTGTVVDATGTTIALSAEGTVAPGHTIRLDAEQLYVSAVTSDGSNQATVVRGVNGSTASAHSGETVELAKYPLRVRRAVETLVGWGLADRGRGQYDEEYIGTYRYRRASESARGAQMARMLGAYARMLAEA
jgi:hypothetical protein